MATLTLVVQPLVAGYFTNQATVTASSRGGIDYSRLRPKAPGADGDSVMVIAVRPAAPRSPGSANYLGALLGSASPDCISNYERQEVSQGYSSLDALAMVSRSTEPSDYFGLVGSYRGARSGGRTVLAGQIMGRLRSAWSRLPEGARDNLPSPSQVRRGDLLLDA